MKAILTYAFAFIATLMLSACGPTYKLTKADGSEYSTGAPLAPFNYITVNCKLEGGLRADQNQAFIPVHDSRDGKLLWVINKFELGDRLTIGNRYLKDVAFCVEDLGCVTKPFAGYQIMFHPGPMMVSPAYGNSGLVPQYQQSSVIFTEQDCEQQFGREGYAAAAKAYSERKAAAKAEKVAMLVAQRLAKEAVEKHINEAANKAAAESEEVSSPEPSEIVVKLKKPKKSEIGESLSSLGDRLH